MPVESASTNGGALVAITINIDINGISLCHRGSGGVSQNTLTVVE